MPLIIEAILAISFCALASKGIEFILRDNEAINRDQS